jgi:N-acetylmuramoyl-L-alanine amidase
MPLDRLQRLQTWLIRLLLITLVLLTAYIALNIHLGNLSSRMVSRRLGQLVTLPGLHRYQVAIVAGHRGFDSGAVCEDGLMEVMVNEPVAELVAEELRNEGIGVDVLDEYDPMLDGLEVDALVSIHADSCVDLTGFKVTSGEETTIPERDARLVRCLQLKYAEHTGLPVHPNTETSDMYGYHAFQRVTDDTPGAIIEIGFIGGDRVLLTEYADVVAHGIAQGLLCFLDGEQITTDQPPAVDVEAPPDG